MVYMWHVVGIHLVCLHVCAWVTCTSIVYVDVFVSIALISSTFTCMC